MRNIYITIISILMILSANADVTERTGLGLLSNNIKEGKYNSDFPLGTKLLPTDMKVTWVTDGEYATDEETLETSRQDEIPRTILFDGNTESNWKSRTYSKWSGGQWASLIVDLGTEHALSAFDVWALHEATRDTEAFYVFLSDDGKTFTPHGMASSKDVPLKDKMITKMSLDLKEPVKARYVKFRIQRRKSAKQQQICEIAIWGTRPEEGVHYLDSSSRPKVIFSVDTIQSGVAKIDWIESSKLDKEVKQWKIYQSTEPFDTVEAGDVTLIKTVSGKDTQTIIYPLKPGKVYYFGVTAVYPQGEYALVSSINVKMPKPLQSNTFGDMLAINHFWGGGSHRESHGADQQAYEIVALDLLAKSGIKHIRWWVVDSGIYKRYYDKGIGVFTYSHGNNIQAATQLGVNAFAGAGNEPDLSLTPPASYIEGLKNIQKKKNMYNPDAVICAPSSGLEDSSIEWLDKFYDAGGKDFFEVLDLHTYTKIAGGHKVPEGYPAGAPEAMYDNMRKINAVLQKHGDENKPIISTEFGYSDAPVNNPSGNVSELIKAQYLVRGLIIHHALGFKRVFLYSFWDSGTDLNFTEHRFGLIDWDLQKKPAYYAIETALAQIGDCDIQGPVKNLYLPSLGYVYTSQTNSNLVSVIWDGSETKSGIFKTESKKVRQIDMFGQTTDIMPDEDGRFSVIYGASPAYLHTDKPIEFISSKKAVPISNNAQLQLKLNQKQLIASADSSVAQLDLSVDNPSSGDVSFKMLVTDMQGNKISELDCIGSANQISDIAVPINITKDLPALSQLNLKVIECQKDGVGSKVSSYPFFLRKLQNSSNPITIEEKFYTLEKPVFILANEKLEVTIDAWRGGRLLEIIDRETYSNQINVDYNILPDILNIPFAFGIWDTFNGKLKNDPMKIVEASDGRLELTAEVGKLELKQTWTLIDDTLELNIKVYNPSGERQKFSYKSHPEYTVGGTGDSVVDVLFFPRDNGIEKLPFWSGLGNKKCGELSENWWAAVDTKSQVVLIQQILGEGWSEPRIWFGQGHYNVELSTQRDFGIDSGKTWEATLKWSVKHLSSQDIEANLKRFTETD